MDFGQPSLDEFQRTPRRRRDRLANVPESPPRIMLETGKPAWHVLHSESV